MITGKISWTSTVVDDEMFPDTEVQTTVEYTSSLAHPPQFFDVRSYHDGKLIGQARMSVDSGGAKMMGQVMESLVQISGASIANHKGSHQFDIPDEIIDVDGVERPVSPTAN